MGTIKVGILTCIREAGQGEGQGQCCACFGLSQLGNGGGVGVQCHYSLVEGKRGISSIGAQESGSIPHSLYYKETC